MAMPNAVRELLLRALSGQDADGDPAALLDDPWDVHRVVSLATTNEDTVKAEPGVVGGWYVYNGNAAAAETRFLKLYDLAADPDLAEDVPRMTIPILAGPGGASPEYSKGIEFGTGIALAITDGAADDDAVAVGAGEVIVNLLYR